MIGGRFAFVVEQTLGHAAHSRNLERFLAERADLEATVIRIGFQESAPALRSLPALRSWSLRASWSARAALRHQVSAATTDCVFIHTQVAALLAGRVMRQVPTVVSLDATPANFDSQGEAYGHRRQKPVWEALKRSVNRRALLRARHLVTWCDWARDSLVDDYAIPKERVTVIHPGVDQELFRPRQQRRPGPPRLLFVGGDFSRKGGHELLEALEGLSGRFEVHLVTGTTEEPLDPRARVHQGLKPQSAALVELYRQADLFVLPSRGDCFPQAVAEAMACGLPVVATDTGAMSEMVRDGQNGHIVAPQAPTQLRAAIAHLLDDPDLRCRMGDASLAMARRWHDARRNWHAILDLMLQVSTEVERAA